MDILPILLAIGLFLLSLALVPLFEKLGERQA